MTGVPSVILRIKWPIVVKTINKKLAMRLMESLSSAMTEVYEFYG